MTHFSNNIEIRKATPMEWLGVGAQIGNIVNTWAFREDLVVNLGKTTIGAPAAFNPASAEIEIDTDCAFAGYNALNFSSRWHLAQFCTRHFTLALLAGLWSML